uniref:Uncharacterized protein n=1 Tax=Arundo donax TaxID=35708 RepID=A0A0A9BTB4_ARUDO
MGTSFAGAWRSSQVPDVHGSKLWIWPEGWNSTFGTF